MELTHVSNPKSEHVVKSIETREFYRVVVGAELVAYNMNDDRISFVRHEYNASSFDDLELAKKVATRCRGDIIHVLEHSSTIQARKLIYQTV